MSIFVDMSSGFIAGITSVYGSMLMEECYKMQGKPASDALDRLANNTLYAALIAPVCFFGIGYLSDKVKIWKIISVLSILLIGAQYLMI